MIFFFLSFHSFFSSLVWNYHPVRNDSVRFWIEFRNYWPFVVSFKLLSLSILIDFECEMTLNLHRTIRIWILQNGNEIDNKYTATEITEEDGQEKAKSLNWTTHRWGRCKNTETNRQTHLFWSVYINIISKYISFYIFFLLLRLICGFTCRPGSSRRTIAFSFCRRRCQY